MGVWLFFLYPITLMLLFFVGSFTVEFATFEIQEFGRLQWSLDRKIVTISLRDGSFRII